MEPNKSDNHIKDLLEQRSILPSQNAWSKLETRLDKDEKKSKKPWFWLSGLAATLVGVLLIVNLGTKKDINTIVNVDIDFGNEINNVSPTVLEPSEMVSAEAINKEQDAVTTIKKNDTKAIIKIKKAALKPQTVNKTLYASNEASNINQNINETISAETLTSNELFVNDNIVVAAATIAQEKEEEILLETNQLLEDALAKVSNLETKTIDAASLLYDVEVEVEQSFRTRMFAKIKDNAMDLKTIIVNRNK